MKTLLAGVAVAVVMAAAPGGCDRSATPKPTPDPHAMDSAKANAGAALYQLAYHVNTRTFNIFYRDPMVTGLKEQLAVATGGLWRYPLTVVSGDRIGFEATPKRGDGDGFSQCTIWYKSKIVDLQQVQSGPCAVSFLVP